MNLKPRSSNLKPRTSNLEPGREAYMIIQCDKCKTRFNLDDSRVTAAGIRVRCSRCSHTFVVRREESEEDSDFDMILQGFGGDKNIERGEGDDSSIAEFSSDKSGEETTTPQDEEFIEDEPSIDESSADNGYFADSDSWDDKDQDPDFSTVDFRTYFEESDAVTEQAETSGQTFAELLHKGVGLPQFHMPAECDAVKNDPDLVEPVMGSDLSGIFDNALGPNDPLDDEELDIPAQIVHEDIPDDCQEAESLNEPVPSPSIREHIWPVADSKDDDGKGADLSPLSITSRRKGSPMVSMVMGALLVLLLGGAGSYFYANGSGGVADLLPDSLKATLGIGKKSVDLVEIRLLEGSFLVNKDAGEIFVMKGDAFNVSPKPLTTIQVKGKILGPKGEILAQQTVFCGNVLSGEQLAMQPYSSMVKAMGDEFGETLANFQVQPGKGIPFVIVFKDVPQGAKDFAAEVASPVGLNNR